MGKTCKIITEASLRKESPAAMKNRSGIIRAILLTAVLIVFIAVCNTASAEKTGKVRGGWLILRSLPSYKGQQIASYPTGTVVTIIGQSGSWYEVKTPDGLTGYMLGDYLKINEEGGGGGGTVPAGGSDSPAGSGAVRYGAGGRC